jgi:hypothetical protein
VIDCVSLGGCDECCRQNFLNMKLSKVCGCYLVRFSCSPGSTD